MPTNPIPAVPVPTPRYYPRLSEIITVDDLPEFLSFVENGLNSIFDKIHYKNLQYSKGYRGDSAFYSLDIVTSKKLALPLPFDLGLVLNPNLIEDTSISSFPITLEYQWEILAFLKTFSSSNFSFSVQDFYTVGLQVFRISEAQVVAHMLNIFVEAETGRTKFEQLLEDINTLQNLSGEQKLKFPEGVEPSISTVITLIENNTALTESTSLVLFAVYILRSDLNETKQKLQEFYAIIAPDGIEAYIKKIITPKAKATLALSAGIEFPRNILRPVYGDGSPYGDGSEKSMFVFGKAQLYADTEAGIGYQLELGGSLQAPNYAMIANTGLILQLDSLKVDLSKKTNIPEADADGRPADFVGVYARAVSVTLPSKWFHNLEENPENTTPTLKIGASDLLVGSGGLSGNIYLETVPSTKGAFNYFNDKFNFNYPITMFEKNDESDVVNKKEIADYQSLLVFLQKLNSKGVPYAFEYPLSLTTLPSIGSSTVEPSTTYIFTGPKEYQNFLSELYDNTLWKTIGSKSKGFKVGFNKFDISFKQNKVIGSNIKGALEINKFKYPSNHPTKAGQPIQVGVEGHLYDDGDFNLTASFPKAGGPEATLFDFVNFKFNSFELGKEDDDYYIGTGCEVSFLNKTMKSLMGDQKIILEKLRIYSDGNIELEGGSIPIPLNISLNLGPVKMSVSNINFGATQINGRKYNFWGFDGAISINPLGVDARGEGVKYYYCTEEGHKDSFLRIQTIEVDLMIPGTATEETAVAIINGMLTLPDPGVDQEFKGKVSLKLPQAKISGGVDMRFMPKYPAFLIDAHIELPTPIPLGFIAISAFRGLLGFRYVATKEAAGLTKDDSWYSFYKTPKPGINVEKFSGPPDSMQYNSPFSIGAGATFGTVADGGHVLSLRAMLLLSLPTLFYIEAGLNVVAGRLGLIEDDPSNPPFFAMVAFGDDSLELAAGADFSIPKDSGEIFQLQALLEAGFFFKNQRPWYVNIGSEKAPITARIFKMLTARAFIMISAQGIEAGAQLDFNVEQRFGPARVRLWAYLKLGGKISFKRPQMGGYISAGGGIQIKLWIINIEIVLDTIFSVESFKPFLIYARLDLSVRVKIGPFRVRKRFTVELQWDINRIIDTTPYSPLPMGTHGDGADNRTLENVKGVHMLTNQAFPLHYFNSEPAEASIKNIIPLDTYIDIKMAKGLLPNKELSTKIGGYTGDAKNYTDMMPPIEKIAGRPLRQVKHQYAIESIGIKFWNGGAWEEYHPFEAVVKNTTEARNSVKDLPWAQWQKAIDQYDSIRVLATNPFSFLSGGEPGWHIPEQFGITPSKLFCQSQSIEEEFTDFRNKLIGQRYYVPTQYEAEKINGLFFKLIGDTPEIVEKNKVANGDFMHITGKRNPHRYRRSLSFQNKNQLEVIFPQSAVEPTLEITTQAKEVMIKAFTTVLVAGAKSAVYEPINLRKAKDGTIENSLIYTKAELLQPIKLFSEEENPLSKTKIDKIVIVPLSAKGKRIYEIRNEIAKLFTDSYNSEGGNVSINLPGNIPLYNTLLAELKTLKADAGNDDLATGTPSTLTFTQYYGYSGKNAYVFDKVIKYKDAYVVSFHPKANSATTILLQINPDGTIIRERFVNGAVTSMQVVNDNLLVTLALNAAQCKTIGEAIIDLDFVVGCQSPIAAMALAEFDEDLNLHSGVQYLNNYSLGFNKVVPLANDELLWINTVENETQINWVKGNDRTLVQRVKINAAAIKLLQHNATEFSLVTKDKKIIRFRLDTTPYSIVVTDTKVLSDTGISEIIDAALVNGKTFVTVKFSNEKFGLAQIAENSVTIVQHDTVFDSAVYLTDKAINNNSVFAYSEKHLFVFNSELKLTRLISRRDKTDEKDNTSIIDIQKASTANEIIMLSSKPNEKGAYVSLFTDQFENCALYPEETVDVTISASVLTTETTLSTVLAAAQQLDYNRGVRNSKIITVNDTICNNGGNGVEDPELDYATYLHSVKWLSKESYFHNTTIPQIEEIRKDNKAMEKAIQETVQPIWRPNTTYYLNFVLTDTVNNDKTTDFNYYYGFKTLGPVGHYPVPDPILAEGEKAPVKNELTELSKSPLTSLRQYIDYNRSYPYADGSLLQSKPVFYGNEQCKISLFFSNPYVYHLFKNWEQYGSNDNAIAGAINLVIKDPLTDVLIEYPFKDEITTYPMPDEAKTEWVDDNDPRIPLGIQLLRNLIKGSPANEIPTVGNPVMQCQITIGEAIKPKSYGYNAVLTNLKPSKLYTVLVNNFFDDTKKENVSKSKNVLVHQFGFQTSRFKDFKEQIKSYYLNDDPSHQALYDINLALVPDQINALYGVISNSPETLSDPLILKYQHSFDRAIQGILKMSPLDPAQSTEVNKIIDSTTNTIVALLIRNPEPFNIPKMPLEEIKDTIAVVDITQNSSGKVYTKKKDYHVLYSKDYSQVLIMHASKVIPKTPLDIAFDYRIWNTDGTPLTKSADKQDLQLNLGSALKSENINL
ncbi:hypothetical protein [Flavobacterium sp. ABG]|uniref:hypothetical protein n=1 Tax=Flavobacterium sp. ABG TaxID=1423322 RepID=UPI00064B7C2F|nr:hypothetical protein [Flavobacterium sp. ABG]KLT67800.1 hypothetical protein AB674_20870 [Flavobacterium sp. ABG]